PRGQLPNANRGILADGSESLAIGTEGHIGDRLGVALEGVQEPFGVLRLLSVDGGAKARQYPPSHGKAKDRTEYNKQLAPRIRFHDDAPMLYTVRARPYSRMPTNFGCGPYSL